jgi:hypothetical protein
VKPAPRAVRLMTARVTRDASQESVPEAAPRRRAGEAGAARGPPGDRAGDAWRSAAARRRAGPRWRADEAGAARGPPGYRPGVVWRFDDEDEWSAVIP